MAQPQPKSPAVNHVLKLVNKLSPSDQKQLAKEMKLQWLRLEVQKGIEQADNGELLDADVVFAELEKRYRTKSKTR